MINETTCRGCADGWMDGLDENEKGGKGEGKGYGMYGTSMLIDEWVF